ncbi:phosphatase PAP2 family protein [Nocardiopsis sp. RSe5-2]|uniref:Phosphatase PAP2 family protein n=1 Tax=Nocardiopsis endophytica TaxID=3018445 RepID=A0ABT4TY23_9ACTN|nr:phosphatase PAP2 family protein [Nocardiopsis endophytica]MDA2809594.1 phosphatase PAP2 family protein [Nocardiopsis endophytica]
MPTLIPEPSTDAYRAVTSFAQDLPAWLQSLAEAATDLLLLGFAVLFLALWWRARGRGARAMAAALLAPVATVAGYLVSEGAKSLIQEERPCRAVADAVTIAACPPHGDWSFPSNHAAIAGAALAAAFIAWRWSAAFAAPLALLEASSRVFVGVHYPHDVAVGLLVGAVVAAAVAVAARGPVQALVVRMAAVALLRPLLTTAGGRPRAGADTAPPRTSHRQETLR